VARSTMSALKTEKKPPRWVGLKIGVPSRRIRFWSAEPPRTLKAAEKSEVVMTPGSTSTALRGSASARPGIARTISTSISWTVIPASSSKRARARLRSASTETPSTSTARSSRVRGTRTRSPGSTETVASAGAYPRRIPRTR